MRNVEEVRLGSFGSEVHTVSFDSFVAQRTSHSRFGEQEHQIIQPDKQQ